MTTLTHDKDKNYSSLCYKNNNNLGDYSCYKVGGLQSLNLLDYIKKNYNTYNNITIFGYSDGGWLGSILGYLGYVNNVIAISGFSFYKFILWKKHINKNMKNKKFIFYFSLYDEFNTGKKEYKKGEMLEELLNIINYFNCKLIQKSYKKIGTLNFNKYYFKNHNNIIFKIYIDTNKSSNHNTLFKSKAHFNSLLNELN